MPTFKIIAIALLVPFVALSLYAVQQVGYWGIFDYHRHSPAGWQVFADLVIAVMISIYWMIKDAKKRGRNAIPFIIISVFLGSIGLLLYFVLARKDQTVGETTLSHHG